MTTPKDSAGLKRGRRWGVPILIGLAVAAIVPGCGSLLSSAEPNVRVVIVNEAGDSLGWDMVPLDVGGTSTGDLSLPTDGSWALTINGIVAIASFNFADNVQNLPGTGLLGYYITVFDDSLEISASRGDPLDGQTTAPEGTPP